MKHKTLHQILSSVISEKHLWKLPLYNHWDYVIGSLKDKVILEKITDDSLVLLVCHPSWTQEIYLLIPMLKKKVNKILGSDRIKNIRLRTADFSLRMQARSSLKRKKLRTNELVHQQTLRYLEARETMQLKKVDSTDLRDFLELYAQRCKNTMKKKRGCDDKKEAKV